MASTKSAGLPYRVRALSAAVRLAALGILCASLAVGAAPAIAAPVERPQPEAEWATVDKADTTTTLTSSANPSVFFQAVTFTATVATGTGTPSGTVTFKDGAAAIGTGTLDGSGVAIFTTSTLDVGIHAITAEYGGDSNYIGSTSAPLTQVVSDGTTVAVSASPGSPVYGQEVTFTANVQPPVCTGLVSFDDEAGMAIGVAALSGGTAQLKRSNLAVGLYKIKAVYLGGEAWFGDCDGSESDLLSLTVAKADTTTTVTSSANPSVFGQAVTFSATVAPTAPGPGSTTPTGIVTFRADGIHLGTGTLDGSGVAIFTTSSLASGSRTISAAYGGDANYSTSTGTLNQTVNKANTATTLSSSVNPSVYGQTASFIATVSAVAPSDGMPRGTVTFKDGGTSIGVAALSGSHMAAFRLYRFAGTTLAGSSVAVLNISSLAAGPHSITAEYSGDSNFNTSTSSSLSQTVDKANTTTTITSDLPDPSVTGQAVTVNYTVVANAPGSGTPAGNVTVNDGEGHTCTGTVAAGSCSLTPTSAGAKTLTATYAGDANFNTSSDTEGHQVNKAATTTTITSDAPDSSVVGQPVEVQFNVAVNSPGSGTPTGNVTVNDGEGNSCSATVAVGKCTLTPTTAGAKTLTATYGGDGKFNTSSGTASHQVNKADTTTTITSDAPDPSVTGQAVTVNYTVAVNSPGSGTPTGNVTVDDGDGNTCSGTVAAGSCTLTPTSAGAKTLTATYGGDGKFNGSSDDESHQVNKADTITTIISDTPEPSVVGQAVTVNYTVAAKSPGSGTPTGNVTVDDGDGNTCSGTVAAGSCTLTPTSAGAKTLTATYGGDGNFNGSSDDESHQVNKADTITTIISDTPEPSVVGQAVTVNYTVVAKSPGSGTPTGNVTVNDGEGHGCSATVAVGQCTLTPTSAGTKTLTASYAGDSNFNASSDTEPHQVNKAATTTTITSDAPDPSAVGQPVEVQFNVAVNSPGSGTPTGNVTVNDGEGHSCTATAAVGKCTLTPTSAGAKTLTASYAGDSNFNGSSDTEPHQVNEAATATTITSDLPDPSVTGQPVTVDYTVVGSGTPTGNVTVSDGEGNSCTGTVAVGQCTLTPTSAGDKTLTASYAGDSNLNGSSDTEPHQVNKADTATTITSDLPDPSVTGQPVTVDYTVVVIGPGSGTPTGNVTVDDGEGNSCTGTVAVGKCTLTPTSVGDKTLTASYAGDSNFSGSSDTEPHRVNMADTATTVTSSANPSGYGATVTFTAEVHAVAPGAGTPSGTVQFEVDGTPLGTPVTLVGGSATLSTAGLAAGTRTISAEYSGDSKFNASSGSITQEVARAWRFWGHVYQGEPGDTSSPLAEATVRLYGSDNAEDLGTLLDMKVTGADGWFGFFHWLDAYPYFHVFEEDPVGYVSTGAAPGDGGLVVDVNHIRFDAPRPGYYAENAFFDDVPQCVALNEFVPAPQGVDWNGDGTADGNDEWIELYNGCDETVELGNWMLDDEPEGRATVLQGTVPYVIPAGTVIDPSGFLVFYRRDTGVALDDNGDEVRLLGPDGVPVDSFTYTASPGPDGAYSRTVDGGGEWTDEYPPSPGVSNAPATPTSTPTATPTSTPTATDTPTATPTATDTPTPTSTPTATDTPTATPTATDTPTPTSTPLTTDTPTPTPTDTPTATPTETPTEAPTSTPTATPQTYRSYLPLMLR